MCSINVPWLIAEQRALAEKVSLEQVVDLPLPLGCILQHYCLPILHNVEEITIVPLLNDNVLCIKKGHDK